MRMLANKNIRLTYHTGWVEDTDWERDTGQDAAKILVASANEVGTILLHNLIAVRDFVLGATGEDTINDPPLASIGAAEVVPGVTSYDGSQMRSYRNTVAIDDMWATFLKGVTGHLVYRENGTAGSAATAYANLDKVSFFAVQFGSPMRAVPAGGGWFTALHKVYVTEAFEHSTINTSLA